MEPTITEWSNCYPSNWKGMIVEEAFQHPAKFSNKLIRKIYDHMREEGWLPKGSIVVDPFGGVGLGGLDCMRLGCSYRGCELEQRFVEWGNKNIEMWNSKFSSMPNWNGDAVLLNGDSRFLAQVLAGAQNCVSSPPYETGGHHKHQMDAHNTNGRGQGMTKETSGYGAGDDFGVSAVVSSPPFGDVVQHSGGEVQQQGGAMHSNYAAAVSSPPYADGSQHTGGDDLHPERKHGGDIFLPGINGIVSSRPYGASINSDNGIDLTKIKGKDKHVGKNSQGSQETRYGTGSAQLGAMKATDKGFQAAVSSPPFLAQSGGTNTTATSGPLASEGLLKRHAAGNSSAGYGESEGNMGSAAPDDFWMSAKQIVEQVFQVLEPGGHACWVVKNYVKSGKEVQFCQQWRELCEAVGFTALHEHHAMLVRHKGLKAQTLEGGTVNKEVSSKSFFRRISEKKGAPPIDFETVYCMVKPF